MKVTQAFSFEAAHYLPNVPDGHKCKRMHGHSYRVEFTFEGEADEYSGFVVDFFAIVERIGPWVAELDHQLLNEIAGLENPTVENMVLWFVRKDLPKSFCRIRIYETADTWVDWP